MSNTDTRTKLALDMITSLPRWGSWAASMREVDTPYGRIGYRQASIMWIIRRNEGNGSESITTHIASEIGVQNSVITRAGEHLVQLGLLSRTPSKEDRRRQFLALTDDGLKASKYIETLYVNSIMGGIESLNDDEISSLTDAMKILDKVISGLSGKPLGA